jgi:preprotein translocase subunit SecD
VETTPAATTPAATAAVPTPPTPTSPVDPDPSATGDAAAQAVALQEAFAELDCSDPANLQGGNADSPDDPIVACSDDGALKYVLAPATVLGTDVADAAAALPQTGIGNWLVTLEFTGEGASKFTAMSEQLVASPSPTNQFGIVLDGVVQSAPVMNERIPGSSAQITGDFTQIEAQQLANVLKYGALPLAFETSSVDEVTPTLGNDSLRAGLIAGMIGLGLVLVYAMFYYRALGLVIVTSLVVAAAMTYVAVVLLSAWIGFTLTLAGVAGLIVAIGITADSFIIYFERIRDEVREGRTLRASIEHGWVRARRTIIAADVVSLLSATVLYIVSIGNVRGFAFALGLSTIIDVVMVFLFTKPLMSWLGGTRFFGEGSRWSGLSGDRLGAPVRQRGTLTTRTTRTALPAEES